MSLMDDDTEPPMDGPDASDGDGADASDAGEPRLLESSHRAISDGLGGFVVTADLPALNVVSRTVRNSRLLMAIKRAVTTRWTACAASKRARSRLQAVDAMGRFLGPGAEEFLTAIFRSDKLQTVRAAAATWLARVARCAGPVTKQRIFAAACERYDAEAGCMNVRQAIERSFPDVYGAVMDVDAMSVKELKALIGRAGLSCVDCVEKSDLRARARQAVARDNSVEYARMHLAGGAGGGALAEFVAATLAEREDQLRRQCEALSAAAAGVMGGKIHLFRGYFYTGGLHRVHFKLERGGDDSVKLAFANPLERSVLLRRYESRGLCGDQKLEFVEIPPQSVRHFATIEFPSVHDNEAPGPVQYTYPKTSIASLPEGRWGLRVPPLKEEKDRWICDESGLLRLEARLRQRDDTRGVEHCGKEPPFELWTFELGPGALACRVDPPDYHPTPTDRTPPGYHPLSPPPPPPIRWRQSLSDERERLRVQPTGTRAPRRRGRPKCTHSEWLHRYPDPVQLLPAAGPINLDVEARPGHPRQFLFSDEAEPQPRQVYNQWPGLVSRNDPPFSI